MYHETTKHIDMDCDFTREHFKNVLVKPVYISFADQIVDLVTKALGPSVFYIMFKLNMEFFHIELEWASHEEVNE